jgi:malonyl CoA-acyl carrier protein transacylase
MANTPKQSLVWVQDELEDVAQLVQAIGMATRSLSSEDANPMLVLVDVTAKKLKAAADALEALRPQGPAVAARLGPKR